MLRDENRAWQAYFVPGTDVLRNRLGITDYTALESFERTVSRRREQQLRDQSPSPIRQTFGPRHVRAVHRHLFQDVYDWAGELRTVPLAKDSTEFFPPKLIVPALKQTGAWLRKETQLLRADIPDDAFVEQAAELMHRLNRIHPFREGNGRSQRAFLQDVARVSGRQLDWLAVDPTDQLLAAVRTSQERASWPFEQIISTAVTVLPGAQPIAPEPLPEEKFPELRSLASEPQAAAQHEPEL